jgi:hypothetical protein
LACNCEDYGQEQRSKDGLVSSHETAPVETVGAGEGGTLYVLVSAAMVFVLLFVVRKFEKGHEPNLSVPIQE